MAKQEQPYDNHPSDQFNCPNCGAPASFSPAVDSKTDLDDDQISDSLRCAACGNVWPVEPQLPASEQIIGPISDEREMITAAGAAEPGTQPISETEIRISELEKGLHPQANLAVIPLPIFWGVVGLVVVLVGVGGWLFSELQDQRTSEATSEAVRAAQILVMATETAEGRQVATQQAIELNATGTAEARLDLAVTATVAQAATSAAATTTTEFQATGTAERVATTNAESTFVAQTAGTATAEHRATSAAGETATAEYRATSTAQSVATLNAQATGTAVWQATATAEKAATSAVAVTSTAERQATATAEKIATAAGQATATAERQATATAEARATPDPPELNVAILGCDTGLDISRWLGEVKNAWVIVQNFGGSNAHNVKIVLAASDEEAPHPDKERIAQVIAPNFQYVDKLTVDSDFGVGSSITVTVTSDETEPIVMTRDQCRVLDENAKKLIASAGELGQTVATKVIFRR